MFNILLTLFWASFHLRIEITNFYPQKYMLMESQLKEQMIIKIVSNQSKEKIMKTMMTMMMMLTV